MDIKDYAVAGLGAATAALFGYAVYLRRQQKYIEKSMSDLSAIIEKATTTMAESIKEAEKAEAETKKEDEAK